MAEHLISKSGINIRLSMKRTYLGEFEEIVLLIVAVLGGNAYGVNITHEIIRQTSRGDDDIIGSVGIQNDALPGSSCKALV